MIPAPSTVPLLLGLDLTSLAEAAAAAFAQAGGKGAGRASALYRSFFRDGRWDPAAAGLGPRAAAVWDSVCDPRLPLVPAGVREDAADGSEGQPARKAVFVLDDGERVETVLVPMEGGGGRATLCVSTQAGCAMGCVFCETASQGFSRNLSAAEIVGQVHAARFTLGWDFSGVVFMGMGEPLANLDNLLPALRVLADPAGFGFARDRLTVCTVGLTEGIRALAGLGWPTLGVSLSLNAARQELRERLMPAARGNPLDSLADALAALPRKRSAAFALNWCLLPGINDSPADAREAAAFVRRIGRAVINVIPYNPGTAPLSRPPEPEEVERFLGLLAAEGVMAKLRGPKGRSIMAGCGQLGGRALSTPAPGVVP